MTPGLKPAPASRRCAAAWLSPVTSGTVAVAGGGGGGGGGGAGAGGGGGGGAPPADGPPDTFRRTPELFATKVPAAGDCATTVPFRFGDETSAVFATRPAFCTAAVALERLLPTTFGTRTRPCEIRSATTEPLATCVPAEGICPRTVPGLFDEGTLVVWAVRPRSRSPFFAMAAFIPTTAGTTTIRCAETEIVIEEPFATRAPAAGASAKTSPALNPLGLVTMLGTRPASFSRATALPCVWATTSGTVTTGVALS